MKSNRYIAERAYTKRFTDSFTRNVVQEVLSGEKVSNDLIKAEAAKKIEELQEKTGER